MMRNLIRRGKKSRVLVLKEQKTVIILCPRISQCRITKCGTQRTYEKEEFNTFCVSMSDYDEEKAISSLEGLIRKIRSLSS